jgi:hypothetical protein
MMFDDLRSHDVQELDMAHGRVLCEGNWFQLVVGPSGTIAAKKIENTPVDQEGEPEHKPRHQGVDQV